ncbi:substrate-binding domain-containing protein [Tamlana sp. 2201CG12-4]|uniref:substrate-binding domain-containing protein n=1 Tax=Tamlana sp. 2201CG12-4 TaxID=3112582 RepID=UPI002DBAE988|nr:substrate-binding domain-containing protein [Tamlana sp. 2201CG12-4]MEC3905528.1 substrate-binding domain-containing protein [Tamlana sp. 2201CG12-4]
MIKKYTIKDIAEMAGVSKGTVDRVLHKRGKVSDTALKKVTEILKDIDYKPNPIAKNLKTNKIYRLCILFPVSHKDSYWAPCLDAVKEFEDHYQALGIKTEEYRYDPSSPKSFTEKALELIETGPDAILMAPLFFNEAQEISKMCHEQNIIISTFNNIIKKEGFSNYIGQDLFKSGRTAAKLLDTLLGKGHIAIVHIDEMVHNATHMQQKERGFKSYFSDRSTTNYKISTISIDKYLKFDGNESLETYFNKHPDIKGVFVTTSKTYAIAEFKKAHNKHLKIVGYDLVDKNIGFLKAGHIDFLINQNPKKQAFTGLSTLAEHLLFDKEISKRILLPIDIINSENYEQYLE